MMHRDPILSSNKSCFLNFSHLWPIRSGPKYDPNLLLFVRRFPPTYQNALMSCGRAALRAGCAILTGPQHCCGDQMQSAHWRGSSGDWHSPSVGYSPVSFPPFPNVQCGFALSARNTKLARQIREGRARIVG